MTRLIWLAGLLAGAGCGLISSDVADFDLSLPEREVRVDTADWELADMSQLPAVDCTGELEGVCATSVGEYCGAEDVCAGACGGDDTCEVWIAVSLWHTFDLAAERPELEQIEGQPLVEVSIDRVSYEITENTLNVPSPPLVVYVAPEGVMSPADAQAQAIGTIPPIEPGVRVAEAEVELTEDGKAHLAERMKQYSTPFNLIVASDVVLRAGDPLPSGVLVATVKATAKASTGL
ncbi:MAG TPA: hypothetical protein VKZ63_18050 [Kofleriaceae bacterium]|nr:hypothetical protein [Kofleriaceae bacterium]